MIQSASFQHRLPTELPAVHQSEKRERIEEVISSLKNEMDLNRTSSEENLQDRVTDCSKRAKMEQEHSSDTDESILSATSPDDRSRFDLYFGNPATNTLFFVYGTPAHNEAKVAKFEEDLRRKKEADIAYHEGLEKLDEWVEDFEGAGENFKVAERLGHPAAKLGGLFIETFLNQ